MSDYSRYKRKFIQTSRTWYGKAILETIDAKDEVTMGLYGADGGTVGEFHIRWVALGFNKVSPKIVAFDDSWGVLWNLQDLLKELAKLNETDPTPEKICKLLLSLGFEDATQEKAPFDKEAK